MANNTNVPWIGQVTEINDGQTVDASIVNAVTDQLVQREQYLYNALGQIQNKSVLVALAQPINPTETGLIPGSQFVVAYLNTGVNQGLTRAISAYTNSYSTSFYSAANTAYTFGITQNIYTSSADVYLQGLINFTIPIDDPTNGLLDYLSEGVRETFRPGPYYLSSKTNGLITANPSGVTVYIGYAQSNTSFLLAPNVNSFNQLYANYQFDILDRPAGTPVLSGGVWTITGSNLARLGWVDVSSLSGAYTIPAGAKFLYNIPPTFAVDNADNGGTGSLSAPEEANATALFGLLPPDPANFCAYFSNGILQRYVTAEDTDGIYSIDQYGIWWYSNVDQTQPWSSDLPSGTWTPSQWSTNKGTSYIRPRMYLIFAKLNPNLNGALVTSLAAYPDGTPNVLNIVSKQNPTTVTSAGDLLVQYLMPFAANTAATSSPTALSDFQYNQATGKVTKTTIPVVSTLTTPSNSGLTLTNDTNGNFTVSLEGQGNTGLLDDLQEYNANFENLGLNTYLRLKYGGAVSGFSGKLTLPKNFPPAVNIMIVLQFFGFANVGSTPLSAGFSFQYAVSTCQNGLASSGVKALNSSVSGTLLTTSTFTTITGSPALLTLPANYVANTALTASPTQFVIPAANIGPDSVVNFKVLQQNPASNSYNNDIGLLTAYWSLI